MAESRSPEAAAWFHEYDFGTGVSLSLEGRELVSRKTAYQQIGILEHTFLGRVLTLDDIIQTTLADEFYYHEMMAHVPLLGRSTPARSVLIIGGGDGGVLREVLVHDEVERVVMVEIDREVIDLTREHLGIHGDYDDSRVELRVADAVDYVRSAVARRSPFDAVIVDSTDPVGPGEVLFTDAFLRDVEACLGPDGVMVRQAGVPFFARQELIDAAAATHRTFDAVSVYRAAIPTYSGGDMAFVAGLRGGGTLRTPRRPYTGRYYNAEVHAASFALPTCWRELVGAS